MKIDDDHMDLLNGVMPDRQWRVRPGPELFDAIAVAAAVPRMPALPSMFVSFGLSMFHDYGIVFEWLGPQSRAEWFQSLQTDEELSVKRWNVTLMPEAR
ncbi:hypothetical protein NUU61_009390 [Penicillium alfredii]|uniref:Uncharacterized protein n=1 Tax=Penicillium alfredii TaxID=1506179 RepID=A0A9W9JXC1_9EURO|nr:uncharacterized protein NUU61_009390 [Penicillium alfredii]KAJ5084811.1 hypothetical protein NUU61_009390 [Penicillium alfredii]